MTPLYSVADIVAATGGRAEAVTAQAVGSISIDSRDIAPDALFVAIKGENFDGHDFVGKAIEAGAVAALVSRARANDLAGLPLIVVDDALEGLYALARFSRARSTAKIVAVTGSVGKTSTKEAIRVVLEVSGRTHASIKSFNNHWGVPLMLARMPADTQFGVFEIGMSAAGEITPLTKMVRPHIAILTTVAPVHLEYFDSVAKIADAKAEIFAGLVRGGLAILGRDHAHFERLSAAARDAGLRIESYGFAAGSEISITDYHGTALGGVARVSGDDLDITLGVATPGRHTIANAVASVLVARALGADIDNTLTVLAQHGAPEGRGAAFDLGPQDHVIRLIDESYNANPASMRAALDVFAQLEGQRKILVLGDMRELGDAGALYHAELRDAVLAAKPDKVYLVGPLMASLADALPPRLVAGQAVSVDAIAPKILETLAHGDSVMIKGSNGLKLGGLVAQIRDRFGAQH